MPQSARTLPRAITATIVALAFALAAVFSAGPATAAEGPLTFTQLSDVTVTGSTAIGSTLTATPGTWDPAPDATVIEWVSDGQFTGRFGPSYTTSAADGGTFVFPVVRVSKDGYTTTEVRSPNEITMARLPFTTTTTPPAILGDPSVGSVLSFDTSVIVPAPDTMTYTWYRIGRSTPVGTGATYTVTAADIGSRIYGSVAAAKPPRYAAATIGFAATPFITSFPLFTTVGTVAITTPPVDRGPVGTVLHAEVTGFDPAPGSITYQWTNDDDDISGATSADYTTVLADSFRHLAVEATVSAPGREPVRVYATWAGSVEGPHVQNVVLPSIVGSPVVGSVLTAVPGTWSPSDPDLYYCWIRGGGCWGQGPTYTVTEADLGSTIELNVSALAPGLLQGDQRSLPTAVVTAPLQSFAYVARPVISGQRAVGATLTATPGQVAPAPESVSYSWFRTAGGVETVLPGATGPSYVTTAADAGSSLRVTVTSRSAGFADFASGSRNFGPISSEAAFDAVGALTISPSSGPITAGTILHGTLAGFAPEPASISWQWFRNGIAIPGAEADRFTTRSIDAGAVVSVRAVASAPGRQAVELTTAVDGTIVPVQIVSVTPPVITGTPAVGERLTATTGTWTPDGVVFGYFWFRDGQQVSSGRTYYDVTTADVGHRIHVRISAVLDDQDSDALGIAESVPTEVVPAVPSQAWTVEGDDVSVAVPLAEGPSGPRSAYLSFSRVDAPGMTAIAEADSGPAPVGFDRAPDSPWYQVSTTAVVSGSIRICLPHSDPTRSDDHDSTDSFYQYLDGSWQQIGGYSDSMGWCGSTTRLDGPIVVSGVTPGATRVGSDVLVHPASRPTVRIVFATVTSAGTTDLVDTTAPAAVGFTRVGTPFAIQTTATVSGTRSLCLPQFQIPWFDDDPQRYQLQSLRAGTNRLYQYSGGAWTDITTNSWDTICGRSTSTGPIVVGRPLPGAVPVGSGVTVEVGSATIGHELFLTFLSVSAAGSVTVTGSDSGPAATGILPAGDPSYVRITTTATTGRVQLCLASSILAEPWGSLWQRVDGDWVEVAWFDTDEAQVACTNLLDGLGSGEFLVGREQPGRTPTGDLVEVPISTPDYTDSAAVRFDHVTQGGVTTLTTSTTGPAASGFRTLAPEVYYDISTTAVYSGSIAVCVTADVDGLSEEEVQALRLYHFTEGAWEDTTSLVQPWGQICGVVTSLSPFVVGSPALAAFTATPTPTIAGTAKVGSTLTATAGSWSPTPDSLGFQWLREGDVIPGATGSTYTVGLVDQGSAISVRVSAQKIGYAPTSIESAPTAAVPVLPFLTPVPTPTVTGTPVVGETLTAVAGTWGPGTVTTTYRWLRDGTAIPGATARTYKVALADAGTTLVVEVTGSKTGYRPAYRTSAPLAVVVGILAPTPIPTVAGAPTVGSQLTATVGTWGQSGTAKSYQWFRDGVPIAGATGTRYTLVAADAAASITFAITGSKPGYTTATTTSAPLLVTTGILSPTPVPTVAGTPTVGSVLTASVGTWGPSGTAKTYLWTRGGQPIPGATTTRYTLTAADLGASIAFSVTGSKAGFVAATTTSAAVTVTAGVLTPTPVPTVAGTARVGSALTATVGTWGPSGTVRSSQWLRDGVPIAGATTTRYVLTAADLGASVTVAVTGAKAGFTTVTTVSDPVSVTAGILTSTPSPAVRGTTTVGKVLTVSTGTWGPSPITLSYQWLRSGVAVPGATAASYPLGAADLGQSMSVAVTGSKPGFTSATLTSGATSAVTAGTLTAAKPTIAGTARAGATLIATAGTSTPGADAVGFQWLRDGVVIAGATSASYTAGAADVGRRLSVRTTSSAAGYTPSVQTSATTAKVVA